MESLAFLICVQLLIFDAVYSQCVNRIVQGPNGPIELLPNQVLIPPGVPFLPPGQRQVYIPGPNPPCQPQPVVVPGPAPIPAEYSPSLIANFASPTNILPGNLIVPNIPAAIPNVLPGNVIVPNIQSVIPNALSGNVIIPNVPSGNLIVPNAPVVEGYAPAVVHDNSVANSLANALQLLVVSSLLSNTLPVPYEPPCYDGYYPGYGYVY